MKHDHFVVQGLDRPAQQLLLLLYDVGDNSVAMEEISDWSAPLSPDTLVVNIGDAGLSDNSAGRQQSSVRGIIEDNHRARVDTIISTFIGTVHYWQKQGGVGTNATALIGFPQDVTVVLESIKVEPDLASRVTALNRRYANLPETASTTTTIHLIHGGEDPVIDLTHAVATQEASVSAGSDVALDIVENLGHAIDNHSI